MVNNSSTKAWSTTSRDTATNKSSYFKKRRRSSGCSSCRPKRKSVSGEGLSRTFFSLRRRRGFSPRHPAPVTIEDAGLVSGPGVGSALFHLSRFIFSSSDDADLKCPRLVYQSQCKFSVDVLVTAGMRSGAGDGV